MDPWKTFLQPFMLIVLLSFAMGGSSDDAGMNAAMRIRVVNEDPGAQAAKTLGQLAETKGWPTQTTWQGQPLTRTQAEQLAAKGEHRLALVFLPDSTGVLEQDDQAEDEMVFFVESSKDAAHPKLSIGIEDAAGPTAEHIADGLQANVQWSMPATGVERTFGLWVGYEGVQVLDNMPG